MKGRRREAPAFSWLRLFRHPRTDARQSLSQPDMTIDIISPMSGASERPLPAERYFKTKALAFIARCENGVISGRRRRPDRQVDCAPCSDFQGAISLGTGCLSAGPF